jgi:hypothetical protein
MPERIVRHDNRFALAALPLIGRAVDLGIGLKYGLNEPADDRGARAGVKLRW